jgi:hypothetical protein
MKLIFMIVCFSVLSFYGCNQQTAYEIKIKDETLILTMDKNSYEVTKDDFTLYNIEEKLEILGQMKEKDYGLIYYGHQGLGTLSRVLEGNFFVYDIKKEALNVLDFDLNNLVTIKHKDRLKLEILDHSWTIDTDPISKAYKDLGLDKRQAFNDMIQGPIKAYPSHIIRDKNSKEILIKYQIFNTDYNLFLCQVSIGVTVNKSGLIFNFESINYEAG